MNIELIALIYKSVNYLKFIVEQLNTPFCKAAGWDVNIRLVANDATPEVLSALKDLYIPYTVYNDSKPNDYYMNRVYRAWNFAGSTSNYDNICFVNSDFAFSDNWLSGLLKYHDGVNIPCSMFYESGRMPSGWPGLTKDFGRDPYTFRQKEWESFAANVKESRYVLGGLYMPYTITKERFIESGGYPEGNIYQDGNAGSLVGNVIMSGDAYYFGMLKHRFGMRHITIFDSLIYHMQEGEKNE
jgi:hypothetical protein